MIPLSLLIQSHCGETRKLLITSTGLIQTPKLHYFLKVGFFFSKMLSAKSDDGLGQQVVTLNILITGRNEVGPR